MKLNKFIYAIALFGLAAPVLTSCGGNNNVVQKFSFTAALKSGKTTLETGDTDQIEIFTNGVDDNNRVYTYSSIDENRATVTEDGYVTAGSTNGQVTITVTETNSNLSYKVRFSVTTPSGIANGGFNYSAAAGTEAIQKRTEILGKLEKYAMDTHLTGITLFENGGYVRYNPRIDIPANEYITGYGFGILSEGKINEDLPTETIDAYKRYYHSAQTTNPNKINAWNETGSQVGDLAGYITGSYWSTKMNESKDGYVWYPMLAADKVNNKANDRPIPVGEDNPLGLYKTWKIYVKTADSMRANGSTKPLKYRYVDSGSAFNGRDVKLEDYKFAYQLLLTGANGQTRGTEMAGDKSYGIKGAQMYYNRTKDLTDQSSIDNIWNEMTNSAADGTQYPNEFADQSLGILTGSDAGGDYIQLELINEIDSFTAMYTLSSSLVSPMPRAFIEYVGNGSVIEGVKNYGQVYSGRSLVQNTLSVGAYKLDVWNDDYLVFSRDDNYFEVSDTRYLIKGIKITNYINAEQERLYQLYDQKYIDSCGLPISHMDQKNLPDVRQTKGDSTFKLNINSCTQERWNELFSNTGSIYKNDPADYWDVKPWMSNDAFLKGLFWSINREQFAENRGVTPSINYFADAYLSDAENGVSYNSTDAHKQAIANYHNSRVIDGKTVDNYGYDYTKAVNYFKQAVQQLTKQGLLDYGTSVDDPTIIKISISWMYQTDTTDYGDEIKGYFEDAFNDPKVSGGLIKLVVEQPTPSQNWEDVYNEVMRKGRFDLAFGAISGNTYNPLNFLEVLKSDNSSGFTLNWGPDTGVVDPVNPLVYDGNKWAFDALWEVSDRGGVVENGSIVKTVKNCYFDGMWKDLTTGNDISTLKNGGKMNVVLEFVDLDTVKIDINKVEIYISGGSNTAVTDYDYDEDNKKLLITVNDILAANLKAELDSIVNKGKNPGDEGYINDPLARDKGFFSVEIYYSLSIKVGDKWGTPTQSYITVAATQDDQI